MKRAALASLLTLLLALVLGPAQAFTVYDATLHKHKPDNLQDLGFVPLKVIYEDEFWRTKAKPRLEPELGMVREVAIRAKAKADLVVMDIECWHLAEQPPLVLQNNIRRLSAVAETMHAAAPGLKIGYYSLLPVTNYWAPVSNNPDQLRVWKETNEQMKAVARHVDAVFPALYTYYDDPAGWKQFAIANIQEAKRYGKPVYPFLWYQYHESNKFLAGKAVPAATWRMQLETCLKYADGVVIWGGHQELWIEQAAWWQETKAFLNARATGKTRR